MVKIYICFADIESPLILAKFQDHGSSAFMKKTFNGFGEPFGEHASHFGYVT